MLQLLAIAIGLSHRCDNHLSHNGTVCHHAVHRSWPAASYDAAHLRRSHSVDTDLSLVLVSPHT